MLCQGMVRMKYAVNMKTLKSDECGVLYKRQRMEIAFFWRKVGYFESDLMIYSIRGRQKKRKRNLDKAYYRNHPF